ncbi:hypothetical protein F5I97DRAFT_1830718 [Phlebopus sp. FC_14]|nr:hypothetical protein F5I97DRAFT_1830718 [Phlebopus sp. FC_14]
MPIRWSSTYVILDRAEKKKNAFTNLLVHADNAQQSFSSDKGPTLQFVLPALEALHKAWNRHSEGSKYEHFHNGLVAAVEKIVECYDRTAESEAYTLVMYKFT